MSQGWIKLHRDIREHWVWNDPLLFQIWVDIIMSANHEEKKINIKGNIITIHRGQFWTSVRKLADRWGMDKNTAMKMLKLLADDDMIFVDSKRGMGTLVSVLNYGKYQDFYDADRDNDSDNDSDKVSDKLGIRFHHKQECIKNDIKNEEEKEAAPLCDPWGHEFQ